MVDHLPIPRPELDGRDRLVRVDRDRNHETAIDVAAAGRDWERLGGLENKVGRPELPAVRELRCGRQILGVSLGRTSLDPIGDPLDLRVRQAPFVEK